MSFYVSSSTGALTVYLLTYSDWLLTTASGELIFNIFSSLAQFERRLIQERTKAGLEAARARGKKGGRKKIAADNPKVLMAKKMHGDHGMEINDICKTLKISRASFYRYVNLK